MKPYTWASIADRHTSSHAPFFSTYAGQSLYRQDYRFRVSGRPPAWSLPPVLEWGSTEPEVVVQLLSLLPGAPAEVIGDLLWGTWRIRSRRYVKPANTLLRQLERDYLVVAREERYWTGWVACNPVCEALTTPGRDLSADAAALLVRLKCATLDHTAVVRLEEQAREEIASISDPQGMTPITGL